MHDGMAPTIKTMITLSFICSQLAFVVACGDASEQQLAPDGSATVPATDAGALAADALALEAGTISTPTTDGSPPPPVGSSDGSVAVSHPSPTPNDCIQDVSAGKHTYSCEGLSFDVTVPAACITKPCGLVVDVHGLTMSAQMEDNNTDMSALGKKYGYIVLQPDAPGAPPLAAWSGAEDKAVYNFMLRVITTWHVNTKRIHITGFSQGGQMTWRFLATYGALLASAAPAGFCWGFTGPPKVKVPLLYMQGTKDSAVELCCNTAQKSVLEPLTAKWQLGAGTVMAKGAGYEHMRYTGPGGALLEVLTHDYVATSTILAGHCYPGSKDVTPSITGQLFGFACTGKNPIHWGEIAMKFFVAHPKP
jgi:hypothetical protein